MLIIGSELKWAMTDHSFTLTLDWQNTLLLQFDSFYLFIYCYSNFCEFMFVYTCLNVLSLVFLKWPFYCPSVAVYSLSLYRLLFEHGHSYL